MSSRCAKRLRLYTSLFCAYFNEC